MQQNIPKTKEEAVVAVNSLLDAFIDSLRGGKASQALEHDTAIELAVELGACRNMVKMINKMPANKATHSGLVAILLLWRERYDALHGVTDHD